VKCEGQARTTFSGNEKQKIKNCETCTEFLFSEQLNAFAVHTKLGNTTSLTKTNE